MENYQSSPARIPTQETVLKDSIRDMIRLQQDHQVPDELFWEIFNARVLLDKPVDMDSFFKPAQSGQA